MLGMPGLAAYANGPLELDVVLDGTETYTTTFVDPATGIPIIVNRQFHDTDQAVINDVGDVLLSATLDRGPGTNGRVDTLFYSPVGDNSGRPIRLIDGLSGSQIDGQSLGVNSAAEYKLANDRSFVIDDNGPGRIEIAQSLGSSPMYSIVVDAADLPPIPISSNPSTIPPTSPIIGLVAYSGGGDVLFNLSGRTDNDEREISALYERTSDGSITRLYGAGDVIDLEGGGQITLDGAITTINDSGYAVVQNGGSGGHRDFPFLTRTPDGKFAELFKRGDPVPGSTTGANFGEPGFDETSFDIAPDGTVIFSNPLESGTSVVPGGIFRAKIGVPNSIESLVLTGETMIGDTAILGLDFDNGNTPTNPRLLGTNGDFAFRYVLDTSDFETGLAKYDALSDSIVPLLQRGDEIGDSGFTFAGDLNGIDAFDVNALGQIAMVDDLLDSDGQDRESLMVFDPTLGWLALAVEGEELQSTDGTTVTVEDIRAIGGSFQDGTFNAGLESGFLSNGGWLTFSIETDNERFYVYRTQLPIPEPSSAILLGAAGLLLTSSRRRWHRSSR